MTNYQCEQCGDIKLVGEACCVPDATKKLTEILRDAGATPGQASVYLEMEKARKRESEMAQEISSLRKSLHEILRIYNAYELPQEYMAEEARKAVRMRSNV